MTSGTVQRNLLHRLGDAWTAFKAVPTPAQLYPPRQGVSTSYLTFPGWDRVEADAGGQDEARVKRAVQSTSVFANMRAIATEFSSSELIVKERKGTKLEDVENHPLEVLWESPNPDMGRSYLMSFWAWSYTMVGKSYLYWLPAGGDIKEIWPIPPFMIKPIPDAKNFIGGYAFRARPDSEVIKIPREYITYSRSPNLFDIRDGLSFLVAAMTPIEMEIAMGFWNKNFFDEQNGIPDGLISVNKDTLDSDLARIRQEIRDFFGGTRRGVAIARETDMKYQAWGRSQKDAEFIQGADLVAKQIGRTMGFPDGYWSESANRANAEQARATMIAGAVWPLLVALHEDMNAGVIKRWWGDNFRAEFKDIRPEDRALKVSEQTLRIQYWTVNELRAEDGKDPLEDPRGEMFVAEVGKGTPIVGTPAAEQTEEFIKEQEDEVAALEAEAGVEEGGEAVEETAEGGLPMDGAAKSYDGWDDWEIGVWDDEAVKHMPGGHDQRSHGRSTARRGGARAAYSSARAGGATVEEARQAAADVSRAHAIQQRLSNIDVQLGGDVSDKQRRSLEAERARLKGELADRAKRTPAAGQVGVPGATVQGRGSPLFGKDYEARQAVLQKKFNAQQDARAKQERDRDAFFQQQAQARTTGNPAAPISKPKQAVIAPPTVRDLSPDMPESYRDLDASLSRVKMPQQGWNASMSGAQQGYLNSLAERTRLNTKEGTPQRAMADAIIAASKSGKLTKWEASQFIDAMKGPKPMSTLLEEARAGARGGDPQARWRAILALPNIRASLINNILMQESGAPF
jgi:HK97 family phage portal protein